MRFTGTAIALAGLAAAGITEEPSTVYSTQYYTITSCEADKPCPASSTAITSSVVPLTTSTIYETKVYTVTDCPAEVPDCPYGETVTETIAVSTTVCPVDEVVPTPPVHDEDDDDVVYPPKPEEPEKPEESSPIYVPVPPPVESDKPEAPEEPELCPTEYVKTISTSVTTVVPTVIYETYTKEVPCPEPTKPVETLPPVPPPSHPVPVPSGNHTAPPVPTGSEPVEAGAAGISGSVAVAALFAAAAYAFA